MHQIYIFGAKTDTYRAYINDTWICFESLPVPPALEQSSLEWIDDKYLLTRFLKERGIPVAGTHSVRNESEAVKAFHACGGEVVVKPQWGSRGRHTTTHVCSEAEVRRAFISARQLCRSVLVLQHLTGSVCRGTVIGGKLVGFLQANPPRITGNGISSIAELIEKTNAHKLERVQDIVLTDEHYAFLERQGYTAKSVLEEGKRIDLTHRTGRLFGGTTHEILLSVHPSLTRYLEKAAHALDVPVVGFDLIIENPEADPDTQAWGIIEGNSLPFIDLHYLPLYGEPSNTAAALWDLWQKQKPAPAGS